MLNLIKMYMDKLFNLSNVDGNVIFSGLKNHFHLEKINNQVLALVSKLTREKFKFKFRDLGYVSPNQAIKELNKIIHKSEDAEGATIEDIVKSKEFDDEILKKINKNKDGHYLEPFVSNIENSFLNPNSNEDIVINGYNFCSHTIVDVLGQRVNDIEYVNPTKLIVNVSVDDSIGTFDVKVSNNALEYLLTDAIEVGLRTEESIGWQKPSANIEIDNKNGTITRTNKYGWNSGAISNKAISYSNGYMEIVPRLNQDIKNNRYMIGLSYTDKKYNYQDIEYALYFNSKTLLVYYKGQYKMNLGTWTEGDVMKIEYKDDRVIFRKNEIYMYHLEIVEEMQFPLFVDCSIHDTGVIIDDVKLFGKLVNLK